jgi:CoA-transferase family III
MDDPRLTRWASSGAMVLTGYPDRPLGPPAGLVDALVTLGGRFPGLDTVALLGERAALMGLWRRGATSCGGSCRLVPAADGWLAVSLPRDEDLESVPAWLELDDAPRSAPAAWAAVARAAAGRSVTPLVDRARLLGLPVAAVGEVVPPIVQVTPTGTRTTSAWRPGVVAHVLGDAPARDARGLRVLDLSALWAGPLCGDLLAQTGADVVKVESTARPDGARRGPAAFFDLLNGRKRSVALDLRHHEGQRLLAALVRRADVVIEASRPRALAQMGIDAEAAVAAGRPKVWVSITGYGRAGESAGRVGFGDDAAAAGGLVVWHEGAPLFCADAVADPVTGLTAADACLDALARGGRYLLDVSMAGVCSGLGGPTLHAPPTLAASDPKARVAARPGPALGADTAEVLAELDGGD